MPPTSRDTADGSGLASSADRARRAIGQVSVWRHNITVADGVVTPGTENCYDELKQFRFPDSFAGRRVLDVGCSDGFYSFETERRGAAEVVAVGRALLPPARGPDDAGRDAARSLAVAVECAPARLATPPTF